MSLKLNKYLKLLRKEASRFERTDINNQLDESFRAKYLLKILFSIISGALVYKLKRGFEEPFISYVSSVLSILVGLFITALIFSFDKFYEPNDKENPDARLKLWDKQAYNYAKKFAFITSYTIVLSVFSLALLAICALFKEVTQLNVFELPLSLDWQIFKDYNRLKLLFIALFLIFQRFVVLYWLLRIMYFTLFIVSSMVQYMTIKIDRKK